jgi:hypothetical protein
MNKIVLKVESSIELIDAVKSYYEEFEGLMIDKNKAKELSEKIKNQSQTSRDKLLKRLAAFESKAIAQLNLIETVTIVFQTYQLIKEYENLIDSIVEQINDWNVFVRPDLITSDISQTRLLSLSKESGTLVKLLVNFKRKYEEFDINTVKTMTDFILNKIKFISYEKTSNETIKPQSLNFEELKEVQNLFHKYPLSIDIYSILMQTVMDQTKPLVTHILQMIEEDKSFILSEYESKYTTEQHKVKLAQNPSLRAFGLIASDISKPLEKLFENYFGPEANEDMKKIASSESIEELFTAISKRENCGVIYIKKITANPIEFSIWKLMRIEDAASYIKESHIGQNVGLSKGVIERMKIINYIDQPDKKQRWNFSEYHLFGDMQASEFFYIIDSLNGKSFRFLRPWSDNSIRASRIPRTYLNGLLTFLNINYNVNLDEEKRRQTSKDRIAIYNEIQESVIMDKIFLKQRIDVEKLMEDVRAEMDAPQLKQELNITLTKFILGKKISNWADLGGIIHNVDLLNLFADQLVILYPKYFKDELLEDDRVKFPFSETLSTFLVELNNVKKSFGRILHEKFNKTPRDTRDLIFKSKDNTHIFINKYLKECLDEIITNKTNVYSSLLMKNKILTIELTDYDIDKNIIGGFNGVPKNDRSFYPQGEGVDGEIYDY